MRDGRGQSDLLSGGSELGGDCTAGAGVAGGSGASERALRVEHRRVDRHLRSGAQGVDRGDRDSLCRVSDGQALGPRTADRGRGDEEAGKGAVGRARGCGGRALHDLPFGRSGGGHLLCAAAAG